MHSSVDPNTHDRNDSDGHPSSGWSQQQPVGAHDQSYYDSAFLELVESARGSASPERARQDPLGGYVRRIAGSLFCGTGIDASVVRFATSRAADHCGRDRDEVDIMVGHRLLQTTAALLADPE